MTPEDQIEEMRLGGLEQEARETTLEWAMDLVMRKGRDMESGTQVAAAALPLAEWLTAGRKAAEGLSYALSTDRTVPDFDADEIQEIEEKGAAGAAARRGVAQTLGTRPDQESGILAVEFQPEAGLPRPTRAGRPTSRPTGRSRRVRGRSPGGRHPPRWPLGMGRSGVPRGRGR